MTKVEEKLIKELVNRGVEFINLIKNGKSEDCRYIQYPFFTGCVFNTIIKDTYTETYYIKYPYIEVPKVVFENGAVGDIDEIEYKTLDVTHIFNK